MKKIISIVLTALIIFFLFLGFTTAGLRLILKVSLPHLQEQSLTGTLLSTIHAQSLSYDISPKIQFEAQSASLHWTLKHASIIFEPLIAQQAQLTIDKKVTIPIKTIELTGSVGLGNPYHTQMLLNIETENNSKALMHIDGPLNNLTLTADLHSTITFNNNTTLITGKLLYRDHHLRLDQVAITQGSNFIHANGSFPNEIHYSFGLPSLPIFIPNLSGTLNGEGTLSSKAQSLKINYDNAGNTIQASISGQLNNQIWSGSLETLMLHNERLHHWTLKAPAALQIKFGKPFKIETLMFGPLLLQSGEETLTTQGHWDLINHTGMLHALATHLNLNHLNFLLQKKSTLEGMINLQADINQSPRDLALSLTGHLNQTQLHYPIEKVMHTLQVDSGTLTSTDTPTNFSSTLTLQQSNQTPLKLTITWLNKPKNIIKLEKPLINIDTQLHVNSIADLPAFIPAIKAAQGQLDLQAQLSNLLGAPMLAGHLLVNNAEIHLPQYGVALKNITIQMQKKNKSLLDIQGSFTSGKGTLHLAGHMALNQKTFPATLTLTGERATLIDTPEYKIILSPDIRLHSVAKKISIAGQIDIPEAMIQPKNFDTGLTIPSDFVIINQKKETSFFDTFDIHTHLALKLDQALFNYQGINATITGNLAIKDSKKRGLLASGKLSTIKGTYTLFGQRYTISQGALLFTNDPILYPTLNLQISKFIPASPGSSYETTSPATGFANNAAQSGTLLINCTGTITHPECHSSKMGNTSGVSSLLTQQALMGALSQLGPGEQALGLTKGIQNTLQLDELNVGSTTEINPQTNAPVDNTTVTVGKKLTDKLSVLYNIGLTEAINILKIRYDFNRHLSAESDNSTYDNGADLYYRWSR